MNNGEEKFTYVSQLEKDGNPKKIVGRYTVHNAAQIKYCASHILSILNETSNEEISSLFYTNWNNNILDIHNKFFNDARFHPQVHTENLGYFSTMRDVMYAEILFIFSLGVTFDFSNQKTISLLLSQIFGGKGFTFNNYNKCRKLNKSTDPSVFINQIISQNTERVNSENTRKRNALNKTSGVKSIIETISNLIKSLLQIKSKKIHIVSKCPIGHLDWKVEWVEFMYDFLKNRYMPLLGEFVREQGIDIPESIADDRVLKAYYGFGIDSNTDK